MAPKTEAQEEEASEKFLSQTDVDGTDPGAPTSGDEQDVSGGGGGAVDFDDILPHLGEFGRYQWFLFLAMFPFALFFAYVYFVQMFITVAPQQHWCRVPQLQHLSPQERWGRRWLACGPMMISAFACLVAAFVPSGAPSVALAVVARFCINMSYNAAIQWAAELFPTGARAGGTSLVHIMGYFATALSPFIVYLKNTVSSLPLLVLAAVAAGGAATSLLLPETARRDLPQSFADAELAMRARREYRSRSRMPKELELKEWQDVKEPEQNKPLGDAS